MPGALSGKWQTTELSQPFSKSKPRQTQGIEVTERRPSSWESYGRYLAIAFVKVLCSAFCVSPLVIYQLTHLTFILMIHRIRLRMKGLGS